jgi:hypothetical protein
LEKIVMRLGMNLCSRFTKNYFQVLVWKIYFSCKEMKTYFGNIVLHSKVHTCPQYGTLSSKK